MQYDVKTIKKYKTYPLRESRKKLGLTLRDLASRVGFSFMQRLILLLFLPSADFQLMKAPSGARSGSNTGCAVTLSATGPCSRTDDCAWPGGAAPARSAQ